MGHLMELASCLEGTMPLRTVLREALGGNPQWQALCEGPLLQYNEVCLLLAVRRMPCSYTSSDMSLPQSTFRSCSTDLHEGVRPAAELC